MSENLYFQFSFYDLESIKGYYEGEGVSYIGEQYVVSIIDHIQTLSKNPDVGRKVPVDREPPPLK